MLQRLTSLYIATLLFTVLLLSACGGGKTQQDQEGDGTHDLVVGSWLRQQTAYHYLDREDRLETPSDSVWFDFDDNGVCILSQRVQGAYHRQLYSWSVTDSLMTLTSDIQLNTGEFAFTVTDSSLSITRQLEAMAGDSLMGWTEHYQRLD